MIALRGLQIPRICFYSISHTWDVETAQRVVDDDFRAHGTEVGRFYPSTDIDEGQDTDHGGRARLDEVLENIAYHPSIVSGYRLLKAG